MVSLRVAGDGRVTSATTTYIADPDRLDSLRRRRPCERAAVQPVDPRLAGAHHRGSGRPAEVDHYDPATAGADPTGAGRAGAGVRRRRRPGCRRPATATPPGPRSSSPTPPGSPRGPLQLGHARRHPPDGHVRRVRARRLHPTRRHRRRRRRGSRRRPGRPTRADADDAKPGRYEVVLAPECVATIAVFLAVYGFNGKSFIEGHVGHRAGRATSSTPRSTLVDDVTDARAAGIGFDTEGTRRRPIALIDGGRSANLAPRPAHRRARRASMRRGTPSRGARCTGPFPTRCSSPAATSRRTT